MKFQKIAKIMSLVLALILMLAVLPSCDLEDLAPDTDETNVPENTEVVKSKDGFKISGTVVESDDTLDYSDNTVLANVTCQLLRKDSVFKECTSSETGEYSFSKVPAGKYTVSFSIEGYITGSKEITVSGNTTLTAILDKESVSNTLKGTILQADTDTDLTNNAPLSNVPVRIERISSLNEWIKETITEENGSYTLEELTAGVYKLTISIPGYIDIEQIIQVKAEEHFVQAESVEAIEKVDGPAIGSASGTVINSRTGYPVANISVYIRKGLNVSDGEVVKKVMTDEYGSYQTGDLEPGNYTAQFVDEREGLDDESERFGSLNKSIKVLPNQSISEQNASITNSEGLSVDTMRIVLTWGSTPDDLDSHFYAESPDGNYHIYYANKTPNALGNLDVDDTSSYGPETTTVTLTSGIYTFGVHDFSDKSNSLNTYLATSGACVKVYVGLATEPEYTFYVPTDGVGTYWDIFSYNTETEQFTIYNQILPDFTVDNGYPPSH